MKRKWVLRYCLGLLVALLIFWGFYGFIEDDNWLAVSALATLILAIAAFWAIRQNYNFRRQEKRERLLNEIIEWVTDINKSFVPVGTAAITDITNRQMDSVITSTHMVELVTRCKELMWRGQYINKIASKFGEELHVSVTKLIKELGIHINLLSECYGAASHDKPDQFDVASSKAHEHWNIQLSESTNKVMQEVVAIKTRGIG